jgi:hypothetical protein
MRRQALQEEVREAARGMSAALAIASAFLDGRRDDMAMAAAAAQQAHAPGRCDGSGL